MSSSSDNVFHVVIRLLTFRASREELLSLNSKHLAWGLFFTWLAGIGRYWDSAGAHWAQKAGLGSLIYVVVLATFLWLLIWPLAPQNGSFRGVLTFLTLVAPPALLYAIPVERFMPLSTARNVNVWFLAVVATWRVGLLFFYLARVARFRWFQTTVAALLPLAAIVTVLSMLNLERAVFDLMAGIDRHVGTANDSAYAILFWLSMLSVTAAPLLLIAYLFCIWLARRKNAAS